LSSRGCVGEIDPKLRKVSAGMDVLLADNLQAQFEEARVDRSLALAGIAW
jgi:hypothetical protein